MSRIILFITFLSLTVGVHAQDSLKISLGVTTFNAQEVVLNREIPWDLVWGDDNGLWFTEKRGTINRFDPETGYVNEIVRLSDVYVSPKENAGMHSMCFHPNWPDSSFLYVHYVNSPTSSKLVRLEIDQVKQKVLTSKIIFDDLIAARSHNGSRMTVDASNNILFSIGDAYLFDPAQDLKSKNGKVLRFTPWGSIPKDNPFPDSYVWSYGHRNPQGLVFGENGILYSSEHGPTTDDEINIIRKGGNYGWPSVNGFCDLTSEKSFCEKNEVVEPIWAFTPTAAPSGLTYYSGDYFPEFNNHLLQCFLKGKALCSAELSEDGESVLDMVTYFENDYLRLRDVERAADGSLYIATSNIEKTLPQTKENDDKIIHITSLEKEGEESVFYSIESEGRYLKVKVANLKEECDIRITTFYGGVLRELSLSTDSRGVLNYSFDKAGVYWLKLIQKGRIVSKMIRVDAVN